MLITRRHPFTRELKNLDIDISQEQLDAWKNGALIQNVAPHLSADEREFIISGIHNWDEIFSAPPDDKKAENIDLEKSLSLLELAPQPVKTTPEYRPPSKRVYSTKNFRPDKLRQLRPVLKYLSPQIILAGGSLRTILNRAHEGVQDFDLFFTSFEAVGSLRERLVADGWTNTFSCPENKLFSYEKGKHKLQLICETEYPGAGELISSFDMSAGCAALHEGVIFFTRQFVRSVWTKKLRMMNVSFPVATIKRLVKYAQKGYNISEAAEDFMREIEGKTFSQDAFRHYID